MSVPSAIQYAGYAILVYFFLFTAMMFLIVERLYALFFVMRLDFDGVRSTIEAALSELDLNHALRVSEINPQHPVCIVAKSGLLKANEADRDIGRALQITKEQQDLKIMGMLWLLDAAMAIFIIISCVFLFLSLSHHLTSMVVVEEQAKLHVLMQARALMYVTMIWCFIISIVCMTARSVLKWRVRVIQGQMNQIQWTIQSVIAMTMREAKIKSMMPT